MYNSFAGDKKKVFFFLDINVKQFSDKLTINRLYFYIDRIRC